MNTKARAKPRRPHHPIRRPPPPGLLEERGQQLMMLERTPGRWSDVAALDTARGMPWWRRVVEERPYFTGRFWCWVVRCSP